MSETLAFGSFQLHVDERLLLREGVPVDLGARAFDLLAALVARPNEAIGKAELLASVWPDVRVEEGSLRFHMAGLRKALDDGREGARYIATLTGRGYCFVAPVSRRGRRADPNAIAVEPAILQPTLPARPPRVVGRDADLAAVTAQVRAGRFVTITGMGGVGKTTVAVAVGHGLVNAFAGAVHLVDLAAVRDPDLVATTVGSMLGLTLEPADAVAGLSAFLSPRPSCLILDTCEHVIEAVAELAVQLFEAVPELSLLVTSREPLDVPSERVYRLGPLACPPEDRDLSSFRVRDFPAVRLFMERAEASGIHIDETTESTELVAGICRRLDGVPLAIEVAAARVASLGLAQTAVLLGERLSLSWAGQRTAPARQKTLQVTLDWSYGLLPEVERLVLRRLSVFAGHFSLDAALAIVTGPAVDAALVVAAIDGLVAKSMVATRPTGATMRYRLLDATRTYLRQHETEEERREVEHRHAIHHLGWLEETGAEWPKLSSVAQRSRHLAGLADVRAALERCFAFGGDIDLGVRLAVAATPVFLSMSQLTECQRWTALAVAALDGALRGSPQEMHLQAALGVAMMFTRGGHDAVLAALDRSLAIAESSGTLLDQIQVLGPLQMFRLRTGAFPAALAAAEQCAVLAGRLDDPSSVTLAHALTGISLHLGGALDGARTALEAALRADPHGGGTTITYLGFNGRHLAGAILARTLWLEGRPDQATEWALMTVAEAEALDQPLTLAIALVWAISVFLWTGDLDRAEQHIDRLFSRARFHSLAPYLAVGQGFRGEIAIRRGDAEGGVRQLRQSLATLHAAPYELLTTPLNLALVQGLAVTGRLAEAEALLADTSRAVEANGDRCYWPEVLRVKAGLGLAAPRPDEAEAAANLLASLAESRRQKACGWELRSAIDLASLYRKQGQRDQARAVLGPVFDAFTEGLCTADLKAAARLLAD